MDIPRHRSTYIATKLHSGNSTGASGSLARKTAMISTHQAKIEMLTGKALAGSGKLRRKTSRFSLLRNEEVTAHQPEGHERSTDSQLRTKSLLSAARVRGASVPSKQELNAESTDISAPIWFQLAGWMDRIGPAAHRFPSTRRWEILTGCYRSDLHALAS